MSLNFKINWNSFSIGILKLDKAAIGTVSLKYAPELAIKRSVINYSRTGSEWVQFSWSFFFLSSLWRLNSSASKKVFSTLQFFLSNPRNNSLRSQLISFTLLCANYDKYHKACVTIHRMSKRDCGALGRLSVVALVNDDGADKILVSPWRT